MFIIRRIVTREVRVIWSQPVRPAWLDEVDCCLDSMVRHIQAGHPECEMYHSAFAIKRLFLEHGYRLPPDLHELFSYVYSLHCARWVRLTGLPHSCCPCLQHPANADRLMLEVIR